VLAEVEGGFEDPGKVDNGKKGNDLIGYLPAGIAWSTGRIVHEGRD
jgi:hypothetical protein